jgi:sugar/nucleoside kinase (ribokinase family)
MSIVVVGSVAFDSVTTPSGSVEMALGGSATYFATAASLFADVRLVAVVGDDFGDDHVAFLKSRGVDVSGLERRRGKTFHWRGRYSDDMNEAETLVTDLNVFADFAPQLPDAFRSSEYVFLANIAPALQLSVLDQVTKPRLVVADTMNLWIRTTRDDLLRMLKQVDVLIINDGEARLLTSEPNVIRAGRAILDAGPSRVVVKKGSHGAVMLTRETYFAAPAYPLESVVDTTGAGDTFAGGFVGFVAASGDLSERTMRNAVLYGTAAASFNVMDFSLNRLKSVTRVEIERRVDELRDFVRT